MTLWTGIAAGAMLMWAISLALALGPLWNGSARRDLPDRAHSWLA